MRALLLQVAGLAGAIGSGFAISWQVGGLVTSACVVFVGLAVEGR